MVTTHLHVFLLHQNLVAIVEVLTSGLLQTMEHLRVRLRWLQIMQRLQQEIRYFLLDLGQQPICKTILVHLIRQSVLSHHKHLVTVTRGSHGVQLALRQREHRLKHVGLGEKSCCYALA